MESNANRMHNIFRNEFAHRVGGTRCWVMVCGAPLVLLFDEVNLSVEINGFWDSNRFVFFLFVARMTLDGYSFP